MLKKTLSVILTIVMLVSLAACASNEEASSGSKDVKKAETETGSTEKTEDVKVEPIKMVLELSYAANDVAHMEKALEEVQAMDKYSHVEWEIIPHDDGYKDKMPIAISVGEQRDVIYAGNASEQKKWAEAGVFYPLNEAAAAAGVDLAKEFGQYEANTIYDGEHMVLPTEPSQWGLVYNKSVFDNAGIPYPDLKTPMTWDDYNELAAQLTSGVGADKIYGALEVNWEMFYQGRAILGLDGCEGFYTEDGMSNIEDPLFRQTMEDRYNRMFVDESVPTYADVATTKLPVTSFMNGKYGMMLQGAWILGWMSDSEEYPRDWHFGVAPMPVDDVTQMKSWGQTSGLAIGKTTADPELAFEIAMDLIRISAEYTTVPNAIQTVEQNHVFESQAEATVEDGVTREDMAFVFAANPEIKLVSEKIGGYKATEYIKILGEEVELYFVNEQDLDTTIANIKERADEELSK